MKITEVSTDALGVSALIAAAGKIHELTDERGVILGLIEPQALGEDHAVAVVIPKERPEGAQIAVTIEQKPRILHWAAEPEPPAEPEAEHILFRGHHVLEGDCLCEGPCCNNPDGVCICAECETPSHTHPGRS